MCNYTEEDDPIWDEEKLIAFVRGFGKEIRHTGNSLKGKSGKVVPTEKLVGYIRDAFKSRKKNTGDETLFDSV